MDFIANFKATQTISVSPPGGTGTPMPTGTHRAHHPGDHLPLPTAILPTETARYIASSNVGHTMLWIVFACMTVGLLGVGVMALRVEKRARVFHWLSAGVLTTAMVSYLVMATGLGIEFVPIHNGDIAKAATEDLFREVYYARYVDWLFTTPLLLLSLAFLAGLSPADTVLVCLADVFMIVTGLFAGAMPARTTDGERSRWLFFAVSNAGFLGIWYILIAGGSKAASLRSSKTKGLFYLLTAMTLILWTAYPVVFALTEGANMLSVDTEIIAYGILDVAAKVGFTFILLIIHSHGEDDTWLLPDWFVQPRLGSGTDGRGGYGSINADD